MQILTGEELFNRPSCRKKNVAAYLFASAASTVCFIFGLKAEKTSNGANVYKCKQTSVG